MNLSTPVGVLRTNVVVSAAAIVFLSTLGTISDAHAKITAFFSAGTGCEGTPAVALVANGPPVKVSLCVTAITELLCGHTTQLQATGVQASGRFHITSVALGPRFSDPSGELTFPIAIANPPAGSDFGATVAGAAVAATARQLLETFDISPQASAKEAAYVVSLAPNSSVGVSADGGCLMPIDASIAASFTLTQRGGKESKK